MGCDTRTPLSHFSTLPLPLKVTKNSSTTKVPFNESKERANHNRRGEVVRLLMSRDPPHELIGSPSVFKGPLDRAPRLQAGRGRSHGLSKEHTFFVADKK